MNDGFAFDFDNFHTNQNVADITFVGDEKIDVGGDKTISFKFVQCIDDFGRLDGSDTFCCRWERGVVGREDSREEGDFSDALGYEFEHEPIDEKGFRFLIDFEIKNLFKRCQFAMSRTDERRHTILDTFSAINSPESSLTSSVLHSLAQVLYYRDIPLNRDNKVRILSRDYLGNINSRGTLLFDRIRQRPHHKQRKHTQKTPTHDDNVQLHRQMLLIQQQVQVWLSRSRRRLCDKECFKTWCRR